jgi:hypothetical protein
LVQFSLPAMIEQKKFLSREMTLQAIKLLNQRIKEW